MFILVIISILIRVAALVWSVILLHRLRDWRMGLLTAVLVCLVLHQGITYWAFVHEVHPGSLEVLSEYSFSLLTSIMSVAFVYGVGLMITERDRAVESLDQHRARLQHDYAELRAIYDNAPIGMCTVDAGLRYTAVNERLARINGLPAGTHLGRSVREVIPALADRIEPGLKRVLETGHALVGVEMLGMPAADASTPRDWSVTYYPIRDTDSKIVAVGATVADITEVRRADSELRASEQRQRALLQAVPDSLFRMSRDGTYLSFNAPDDAQLIAPPSEFLGRRCEQVLPTPLARQCMEAIERTLATGSMQTYEYTYEREGRTRHWEVRMVVSGRDEVLLLVRNITARKAAEISLVRSEARKSAIMDAALDAIITMDQAGRIIDFNPAAERTFGRRRAEVVGRAIAEVIIPERLRGPHGQGLEQLLRAGRTPILGHRTEMPAARADGSEFPAELAVVPTPIPGGPMEFTCYLRDITDRKANEEALRSSREDLERAQTVAHIGSWASEAGADGRLNWSAETCRIFGIDPEEFDGRVPTFFSHVHPDDLPSVRDAVDASFAQDRRYDFEHRIVRPDGDVRWVHEQAAIVRGPDGRPLRMVGTVQDITDRKKAELLQASQNRFFERLATGDGLPEVLDAVNRLLEEQEPDALCSILLMDETKTRLFLGASRGLPEAYNRIIDGLWISPTGGSCGTAAATGRRVVVGDLQTDPLWEPYRHLAMPFGLRACWSQPIFAGDGGILGTLAIYFREPRAPTPREIGLLEYGAHLAGIAIERRRGLEALRNSEERYRRLAEHGALGIWEVTLDGHTVYANPAMCRMLEVDDPDELRDIPFARFFPAESLEVISREKQKRARGEASTYEVEIIGARGGRRRAVVSGAPVLSRDRPIETLVGTFTDITDRKRAEDALRESEERFRIMADSAPVLIWVADAGGTAAYYNRTWLRFTGRSLEEELDHGWERGLHPDDRHYALATYEDAVRQRRPFTSEYRFARADGTYAWLLDQGAPRFTPGGEFAGFIGSCTDITELKEVEQALAASEHRFRRIVDSNMVGIFFWTDDGAVTDANDEFLAMIGASRDDLRAGRLRWTDLTPPEHRALDDQAMAQIADSGVCTPFEKEYLRADGSRVPVLVGGARLDAQGRTGACFVIDISQRRTAEEERSAAEQRYRTLFEQSPDGIAIIDPQTAQIVEANASLRRMLGGDAVIGQPVHAFDTDANTTGLQERIDTILREGHLEIETRLRTLEGGTIDASIRAHPIRLGGRLRLHAIVRDITEARLAAEKLRQAEQRNALLISQTPLAVMIWDTHQRVLEWNPGAERIFGYTAEEARGRSFLELIVPPASRNRADAVWHTLLAGTGGTRASNDNITKDGKTITCEWYNTTLVDARGSVIGVASLCQDVTERRRLEEELRRAQKMEAIGQLAGGVAHDFSNLLTAIFGFTNLARRTLSLHHPAVRSLDRVDEAARQAAGVSRALLTFSRAGASEKKPVRLAHVVEDALRLLRRTLPATIEVSTSMPRTPVWVLADSTQLQQVVMNLAINARDAMPEGGRLTIAVAGSPRPGGNGNGHGNGHGHGNGRGGPRTATLTVSDTGVGMTPDVRTRIFEPFFTTKPPGRGTGLGLPIVHSIVQDHSGRIDVASEPGRGSTFTVSLPAIDPEPSELPAAAALPPPVGSGQLIVLADPHRYVREIVASMLESIGFQVVQAGNCEELGQTLQRSGGEVRAVVLDLAMCGLNGGTCVDLVRGSGSRIRLILIAGGGAPAPEPAAPDTIVLCKPFQMSELSAAVSAAMT
jgi:PAS domain S-box-containing protein